MSTFNEQYHRICNAFAEFRLRCPPKIRQCKVCHGPLFNPDYSSCYLCEHHSSYLAGHCLDLLTTVSICFDDEQFYQDLMNYKSTLLTNEQLQELRFNLSIVLHRFLAENPSLYQQMAPDLICWIPSTRREYDPMETIAKSIFPNHATQLLASTGLIANRRNPDLTRFSVSQDVNGKSVLILDDLMTSGSHLFSAAGVLKQAGASRVSAVTLGRFVRASDHPGYKRVVQTTSYRWNWPTERADGFLF